MAEAEVKLLTREAAEEADKKAVADKKEAKAVKGYEEKFKTGELFKANIAYAALLKNEFEEGNKSIMLTGPEADKKIKELDKEVETQKEAFKKLSADDK